jgi:SAM-dependent methyltransferase
MMGWGSGMGVGARLVKGWWRSSARVSGWLGGFSYTCPGCGYKGAFVAAGSGRLRRPQARCPSCGAAERHRLQVLVLDKILAGRAHEPQAMAVHFAPEPIVGERLKRAFGRYLTADLSGKGVDMAADLRALPFEDASVDLVFASHVLEHVDEDRKALSEIARVLRPGGLAVLPVPILCERTVEYGAPNTNEHYHVRAPGPDYFDRYREVFSKVEVHDSVMYPLEHQLLIYEDRSFYPTPERPLRTPMQGGPFKDYVPVCLR